MKAVRTVNVQSRSFVREDDRLSAQVSRGGKPVTGIDPKCITSVDEEVMEWVNAFHIHAWFVRNVQNGKDDGEAHSISDSQLRKLLSVCETVVHSSHLVRESVFKETDSVSRRHEAEADGTPPKVIKNIAVAHKLLPIRASRWESHGPTQEYGEEYLKQVEATRDWTERMLLDSEKNRIYGCIKYLGH